jgi:PAS domain-containing protein
MYRTSSSKLPKPINHCSISKAVTLSAQTLKRCMQNLAEQRVRKQQHLNQALRDNEKIQKLSRAYKQIEATLQDSEACYQSSIATADNAFLSVDSQRRITAWRQQAEVLFGWTRAAILNQMLKEIANSERFRQKYFLKGIFILKTALPLLGTSNALPL